MNKSNIDDVDSSFELSSITSGEISKNYEFGKKLGSGAYGFVYEATRKTENKKVNIFLNKIFVLVYIFYKMIVLFS